MALGFGNKTHVVSENGRPISNTFDTTEEYDPEATMGGGRSVGGRVAPLLPAYANNNSGSDDDSIAWSVEKQVEMESANSIKFRTCTWQKVRSISL